MADEYESVPEQQLPPAGVGPLAAAPVLLPHESNSDAAQILQVLTQLIARYKVDPLVRRAAILMGNPQYPNDSGALYRGVEAWVRARVLYVPDPEGEEFIVTPDALLLEAAGLGARPESAGQLRAFDAQIKSGRGLAHGDCDDFTALAGALLASVGFTVRPVGVMVNGAAYYNHVLLQVQDARSGYWLDLDLTVPYAGQRYGQHLILL